MNIILLNKLLLISRITFLYLFFKELRLTKFKKDKNKWICFFLIVCFGFFGYSIYIAFKTRLVVKREFNPKFISSE